MHDDVPVVHQHPRGIAEPFDAHRRRTVLALDTRFDLFDEGADLALVAATRQDERVGHPSDQVTHRKDDGVLPELVVGRPRGDECSPGHGGQCTTSRTLTVNPRAAARIPSPITAQRRRWRRASRRWIRRFVRRGNVNANRAPGGRRSAPSCAPSVQTASPNATLHGRGNQSLDGLTRSQQGAHLGARHLDLEPIDDDPPPANRDLRCPRTRARDDDERHGAREVLGAVPGRKARGQVGPDDEELLRCRAPGSFGPARELLHRLDGVARAAAIDLDSARLDPLGGVNGGFDEGQAILGRADPSPWSLLPRFEGDDQQHSVQLQDLPTASGCSEVTDVGWVEGPPQQPETLSRWHAHGPGAYESSSAPHADHSTSCPVPTCQQPGAAVDGCGSDRGTYACSVVSRSEPQAPSRPTASRDGILIAENAGWHPGSWRDLPAAQQPVWPDEQARKKVEAQLAALPPLVFAGEVRALTAALAEVSAGRAFLLQAGDCAESFTEFSADSIRDKLKVILQMAVILTYAAGVPVVKVGRIAGQFAKPRSSPTERIGDQELEAYRGHMVNDDAFNPEARRPDPSRLITAYHQSAATLNLLRAFTKGGFADLAQVHAWNQEFVASLSEGRRYERIAAEIDAALRFMAACGIDLAAEVVLHQVDFWTSHEALILHYEEALTRWDSLTGMWVDCSGHLLWIGERTRQADGAHAEFLSGVINPVAFKIGPEATPDEVVALCERLDPNRVPGRLTLITRLGARRVEERLPMLIRAVREAGHPVVWACDPMHGNTFVSEGGRKTRRFDDIVEELRGFFAVHRREGTWPGGVHIELTGDDVTECLGGTEEIAEGDLHQRYTTTCDPRLNARQSLDLAFRISDLLRPSGAGHAP